MMRSLLHNYFASLYSHTMTKAYHNAYCLIAEAMGNGGQCLDCGAGSGGHFNRILGHVDLPRDCYTGIEWDKTSAQQASQHGFPIIRGDLNKPLPFADDSFQCVFGLSVLEHLIMGCHFIQETQRILKPGGRLVILTPNLSAWFNIALLIAGKMPSSGPHPDSAILLGEETPVKFRETGKRTVEEKMPTDRHLVVFTHRVLKKYLAICGFHNITGHGYGIYPFPNFTQPTLERIDPWHAHQLVVSATK